ncbi:DUF4352 domain-containing protein [Salimicrobium album]|uniref:DUF4352 domain-containing protein n=1 Tax=Salimicrobium album TaxID=50717 RepID=A0A1H3J1X9_9BACI|nr:DUF4352 domain-containing protein [Salimicrobium album]SDY33595.1 protein of unknown function [Salimicrobium album]
MKKFFKFGCLGLIGIIILVVLFAALGGDDSSQENNNEESTSSSESSGDSSSDGEKETYAMGEEVAVGDVTYVVEGRETAQSVGPEFMKETTEEMFLTLEVTFTNNGNEAAMVDSDYFELVQGDTTFSPDSEATMAANSGEDNSSFFLEEVNPGSSISGTLVFDVVSDVAEAQDLQLKAQEGIFGSVSKLIELQ